MRSGFGPNSQPLIRGTARRRIPLSAVHGSLHRIFHFPLRQISQPYRLPTVPRHDGYDPGVHARECRPPIRRDGRDKLSTESLLASPLEASHVIPNSHVCRTNMLRGLRLGRLFLALKAAVTLHPLTPPGTPAKVFDGAARILRTISLHTLFDQRTCLEACVAISRTRPGGSVVILPPRPYCEKGRGDLNRYAKSALILSGKRSLGVSCGVPQNGEHESGAITSGSPCNRPSQSGEYLGNSSRRFVLWTSPRRFCRAIVKEIPWWGNDAGCEVGSGREMCLEKSGEKPTGWVMERLHLRVQTQAPVSSHACGRLVGPQVLPSGISMFAKPTSSPLLIPIPTLNVAPTVAETYHGQE
ncbi:hypothetical protein M8818_001242 [Zalaria obscura]|uniref:Uncharacterized protein n=1 Tax=Zalaria obscura TaxID=2024903 RepID=A0ACC3SLP6_9PEZI